LGPGPETAAPVRLATMVAACQRRPCASHRMTVCKPLGRSSTMANLVALAALVVTTARASVGPPMTPIQQRVYVSNAARAARDSAAAAPGVLAMLDSEAFRTLWRQRCPSLAALPAADILSRYRTALEVSEVVHGFPANDDPNQNNALDMSIDMMLLNESTYFFNQWQMPLLFRQREFASYFELVAYLAPAGAAEPAIWGFPPFRGGGALGKVLGSGFPTSIAEADDRIVYTVLNQHRVDFPAYLWGDVAVVFSKRYIRNATLLEPTDTGDYVCGCNRNFTGSFCPQWNQSSCKKFWFCHWDDGLCAGGEQGEYFEHNCSAWPGTPSGTWEHNDHLFAPFAFWYNETEPKALDRVATTLARMLVREGVNVSASHFDYYYEAELFGKLEFPAAVSFLIADVGKLFGTPLGGKVRQWAARWGWPLTWSPGVYANPKPPVYPPQNFSARRRILDPAALRLSRAGGNVSGSAIEAGEAAFAKWWTIAEKARSAATEPPSTAAVNQWWNGLVGAAGGFQIDPLYGDDCAAPDRCLGTLRDTRACVCYDE